MNILFMGTPEFAAVSLRALLSSHHSIAAVVTAPDKPRGRGQHVSTTPVKALAEMHAIPVLQPSSFKDADFLSCLPSFHADLFVVVAFRILPPEVFTIPPKGTINLHASLLPKYRGAAPINWALIRGEVESGVTTFFIREQVDTGNLLLQRPVVIPPDMTAGELHDVLARLGSEVLVETVDSIERGTIVPVSQDDTLATPAPKIFRSDCRIDWNKPAEEVHNLVRGLSPHPAAWTTLSGVQLKILRTWPADLPGGDGGSILKEADALFVECGSGAVEIVELQQEGRKAMSADAFLRGYRLEHPARFD